MRAYEQEVLNQTEGIEVIVTEESHKGVPSYTNWCRKKGFYEASPISRIIYARCFQDVGSNDVDYVEVGSEIHTVIDRLLARN